MRRAARWTLRIGLGLIGLAVLGVAVIAIAIHTDWGREQLRAQVEHQLAASFTGGGSLGRIEGSPFGTLVVEDLVIDGPDRKPAITVKRLAIEVGLLPLISHQLTVKSVVADGVDVRLVRDASGQLAVAQLMKPGPKSQWSVLLPHVEVHRGHVSLQLADRTIELDDIQLDARAHIPNGGPIDASAVIGATWREPHTPIALAAVFHAGDDGIALPAAVAQLGDAQLAAANVRIPQGRAASGPPIAGALARGTAAQPSGIVAVAVPAAQIARFAPTVNLPADVALAIDAGPGGDVALVGALGAAPVRGFVLGDLSARSASGLVSAAALPLAQLTGGSVDGTGGLLVAFDVQRARSGRGVVALWGDVAGAPHATALVALDGTADQLRAAIGAASDGGLIAGLGGALHRSGDAIELDRATLVARSRDPAHAAGGRVPVHGSLRARLTARGALAPTPRLAIAGDIAGEHLRFRDLSAASLHLAIDASGLPGHPSGRGKLELVDVVRGDLALGALTASAASRPDGKLAVSIRSQPKQAPWLVDVDALVTTGHTIVVELQRHLVRAAGGAVWTGQGGRIVVAPDRLALTGLASTSADGRIAASGSFARATGDLTARLDAALDARTFGYRGRLELAAAVARRSGRWTGDVHAKAAQLAAPGRAHPIDAELTLDAKPGRITGALAATSAKVGAAHVALEVDAPADLADVRGWRRLGRAAVRDLKLELRDVELAPVSQELGLGHPIAGRIDGAIEITPSNVTGDVVATGVRSADVKDAGTVDARLALHPAQGAIAATLAITLQRIGRFDGAATFAPPEHLFDPAAWRALGISAVQAASLRASDLAFEPGTLERFGIVSDLRGRVGFSIETEAGLRGVRLAIDLAGLHGGVLAEPVEIDVAVESDAASTRGHVEIHSHDFTLLSGDATIPLALAQLRARPRAILAAPLHGEVTIPSVPAPRLLAVLGNTQVVQGTFDGQIALAGTVAQPTGDGRLVARGIGVPPEGRGPAPSLRQLELHVQWDGTAGKITAHGDESAGGTIDVEVNGRPDQLAAVTAKLSAHRIDLAPLVAFMPGPAGGVGGTLEAQLAVVGVDPRTMQLSGSLDIVEGRLPISPEIGTMFHGKLHAAVDRGMLQVTADGKLGKGTVQLSGAVPIVGSIPTGGKVIARVSKVQLIGTTEPVISSEVTVELTRPNNVWRATVHLAHSKVDIPDIKGEKLAPVGIPEDITIGKRRKPANLPTGAKPPPLRPVLIAEVELGNVDVKSKELRGTVTGKLRIRIGGPSDGVGIIGNVAVVRGDLDLFDRRYQVDRAVLAFDGTTDPMLDIRITYDFPDVTTITEVRGRLSKPELALSSSPGIYSQAELLGFLLGGEPGGDPNMASAQDKVTAAGASLVANQLGGYVKKAIPVDIDVLRYQAATATTSAAVTVGTWLSHALFLAYRQHLEARPDENTGEAQVEYWLRRRLVLQGTIGDRGYDGIDLLWRRRW